MIWWRVREEWLIYTRLTKHKLEPSRTVARVAVQFNIYTHRTDDYFQMIFVTARTMQDPTCKSPGVF